MKEEIYSTELPPRYDTWFDMYIDIARHIDMKHTDTVILQSATYENNGAAVITAKTYLVQYIKSKVLDELLDTAKNIDIDNSIDSILHALGSQHLYTYYDDVRKLLYTMMKLKQISI